MDHWKSNRFGHLIPVSLLIITGLVLCFLIWNPHDLSAFQFNNLNFVLPSSSNMTNKVITTASSKDIYNIDDELERALAEASMVANKTLIIAVVNKAYVEGEKTMLDLFLDGFWIGEGTRSLLDHLLLVAVDQTAFDRCRFLRLHCYRIVTEGVDFGTGEELYMSKDFIKMMWSGTRFLADVLKRGYSFIFTDIDIMWLRNPFTVLSQNKSEDLQISCDMFNGNSWSKSNYINTGLYFVRSNNKTVALFDTWHSMKDNSSYAGMKEQDVLASLLHKGLFMELGIRTRFLNTLYFSGFCQDSRDFGSVVTVHANCCRTIVAKVTDLVVVLRDWKRFKLATINSSSRSSSSSNNGTEKLVSWSKHIACGNSWRGFKNN